MKKTLSATILALLSVLGFALFPTPTGAQASFTTTTLAAAITTPITNPGSSIPAQSILLASGTGVTTTTLIYVDRELMQVTNISASPRFAVIRGYNGTLISSHANGAPVKIGLPQYFGNVDKSGSCTATAERALPFINISTGAEFACTNSIWVRSPFFDYCGTVAACAGTNTSGTVKVAFGSVALASASPSIATVTGINPAFTSSSTYVCTATPVGADATIAGNGIAVTNVSGTSFTLTGPNTVTTVVNYTCIGT